jgi:hypothetical protein
MPCELLRGFVLCAGLVRLHGDASSGLLYSGRACCGPGGAGTAAGCDALCGSGYARARTARARSARAGSADARARSGSGSGSG